MAPFVHRFRTKHQRYVYDVNTRRIIAVSPAVWDVLEDYGILDRQGVAAKHSAAHTAEEVSKAIEQIGAVREQKGLFLSIRPEKVVPPEAEKVQKMLDGERQQLILNVTEQCNFRCSYCVFGGKYQHHRTHSDKAMTWEVARRAIDEFLSHSGSSETRAISFYGGEPLLNFPLVKRCVEYVRHNNPDPKVGFAMTTNGYLLRHEIARFLADEEFAMTISLDGPAEIHDRNRLTRDGSPTWATVFSNLEAFLARYPQYKTNSKLRFSAVATPQTRLCDIEGFFRSRDLFTDSMGLDISEQKQIPETSASTPSDEAFVTTSRGIYQEFIEALKNGKHGRDYLSKSSWLKSSLFQKPLIEFHKRGYVTPHLPKRMGLLNTCVPGARKTFVTVEGDYLACERVTSCDEQVIGNVRDGLDTQRVMMLLSRWLEATGDKCRDCWCVSMCKVGCFATVGEDGAITREAKLDACIANRKRTHQLLFQYCDVLEDNPEALDFAADIVLT
jgi:uncharacterized protein